MPVATPLLKLAAVAKCYAPVAGGELITVLREISFELNQGESMAIVGPSGSGKSTLLNIIGTLDQPSSGDVILDGENLGKLREEQTVSIRSRKIGLVFQAHHLLPQCTVLENVLVPTLADKSLRPGANERARKLLERVGLGNRVDHRPGQLSGGERQRVAVVRALINQPRLLLADEPTGALDRHASENLADLLVALNREQNVSLIVVTHAMSLAQRMQKVLELRDGGLIPT